MDPAERGQHALVEALHADGDAVHAGAAEAAEARRLDGAGIRFERDLGLRVERDPRAHAGEQRVDRLRGEEARGAAADEDAGDTASPDLRQGGFNIPEQDVEIFLFRKLAAALVRIEIAV